MELVWQANAWEDYLYWQEQDTKVLKRINELIKDALRSPFKGIGKPEPLKGDLSGCWSRRITGEHTTVPWYYWEAATIYRKLKRYDEEAALIRRFARNYDIHFRAFSKRYRSRSGAHEAWAAKFLERLDKAKAAAAAGSEGSGVWPEEVTAWPSTRPKKMLLVNTMTPCLPFGDTETAGLFTA